MTKSSFAVYLAAPLFNARERAFNLELAGALEGLGARVFLPQRDGALLVEMLSAGVPQPVAERRVFLQDTEAMRSASLGVAVLDGAVVDDGVAFEIGFLHALSTPCVGLQTDVRRALPSGNNPMIAQSLYEIVSDEARLLNAVRVAIAAADRARNAIA
jgi:nucleoside 2-deoxyribosyltransferase